MISNCVCFKCMSEILEFISVMIMGFLCGFVIIFIILGIIGGIAELINYIEKYYKE